MFVSISLSNLMEVFVPHIRQLIFFRHPLTIVSSIIKSISVSFLTFPLRPFNNNTIRDPLFNLNSQLNR